MYSAHNAIKMPDAGGRSFQPFDLFPFPVEIFAPDGTVVFFNRSGLELNGIKDPELLIGKYNLLHDPVCNDRLGLRETIIRAFHGETVFVPDFRPPIQDLVDRGIIKQKPYESAVMEVYLSPVKDKDNLVFVVGVFIVKSIFRGKPEVARTKEYIHHHWQGKFESEAMAKYMGMGVSNLYKHFKEETGMTPGEYHKKIKIEHIKEKLRDKNLTVKKAFEACGENSNGWVAKKLFKELAGMSPKEWRENEE